MSVATKVSRVPALIVGRLRRVFAEVRARGRQTSDENFVGFDKYRKHGAYHWTELEQSADYRGKAEFVRALVPAGASVLDIGCGDGAYMYVIADRCRTIVGLDADVSATDLARAQLRRRGVDNATVHLMPISNISLADLGVDAPFDLIYSMDVIEHLPNPEELLAKMLQVASPGSTLIVGTPKYLGDDLVSKYHVREFSSSEFENLVASYMADLQVHELPMRRDDGVIHADGFLVAVGTPAHRES